MYARTLVHFTASEYVIAIWNRLSIVGATEPTNLQEFLPNSISEKLCPTCQEIIENKYSTVSPANDLQFL